MAIPQTFDAAFARVKQLVSTFTYNESKYLAPGYSEAQARLDFIDKFWIALGWDVNHEAQTDPYKREVSLDETGELFFTGGVSGGYGILTKAEYSRRYLLGLLNSKVLEWFIHQTATQMRGGWYSYESRFIRGLPIHIIDSSNAGEKAQHDRMVQLVDQMLEGKRQLASARTERDKTFYDNKCATLDRQIDQLVYELYDLTPEEIAIVEETKQ